MEEVKLLAKAFLMEIMHMTSDYDFKLLIERFRSIDIRNIEIRHKSEIARTIETEKHRIKIRWLYEPNVNQLDDILKNDESHDDLMAAFVSSFQEANLYLRILASTTVRRHVSEALAQLDKYEQLWSEMRVSKSNQLNDKLHLMYIDTSEIHRRQHKEVQTIIDFFDLGIVVKETKMGLLLREIADTNRIITDD
jgi:hypothetical protein